MDAGQLNWIANFIWGSAILTADSFKVRGALTMSNRLPSRLVDELERKEGGP